MPIAVADAWISGWAAGRSVVGEEAASGSRGGEPDGLMACAVLSSVTDQLKRAAKKAAVAALAAVASQDNVRAADAGEAVILAGIGQHIAWAWGRALWPFPPGSPAGR